MIDRIKAIRPEFEGLRDVDIENALKDVPRECWKLAVKDFERDMVAALSVPDMPVKVLRGYLDVAARGGRKKNGAGDISEADEVQERAYAALARKGM